MKLFKRSITRKDVEGGHTNDVPSFGEIFREYFVRLCHFSFQIVGDKENAEDIVQDAFVKYWHHRQKVAPHTIAIKNFLYSTVRNASLNAIRHKKVVQQHLNQQDPAPIDESDIINAMIRSEVVDEIYRAIKSLPASCQRISRMGYLEGMKNAEIAQELRISVNTVKTQKQRGLQLLRLKLKTIS